ncbi:MAG: hypothetical protein NC938_00700 [Candidatus Omnitrophica bacterium]|nr:hypothetical protein [Candidatus Omnitrophota bacterium]MCM8790208.1 hypothetical protein [Candidatus Omnitrophota bacterium]
MGIFLTGVSFLMSTCAAETITSYSGQYTSDLEQKQILLNSIKEDAQKTEAELKENADKIMAVKEKRADYLEFENVEVVELMPPAEKINLAFAPITSSLSPEPGPKRIKESKSLRATRQ